MITDPSKDEIHETIDKEGFALVASDHEGKRLYYTVGAKVFIGSEFYLEHMEPRTVELIVIHMMGILSKQDSEEIPLAFTVDGILAHGYKLGFMVIDDDAVVRECMPATLEDGDVPRVYQVLPPDTSNRLPWDEGYDADSMPYQSVKNQRFLKALCGRPELIPNLEVKLQQPSKTLH